MRPSPPGPLLTVGGLSLIAGPVIFMAATFVHPGLRADAGAQLEVIDRNPVSWYLTHIGGLAFVALMIPAVLALVHLAGARNSGLARLGGGVALAGLVGWGGVVSIYGFAFWQMGVDGDRAEMSALLERVTGTAGAVIPTRGLAFAAVAGIVGLAVALMRARTAPRWAPPVFSAGLVGFGVAANAEQVSFMRVATVLMAAGLGAVGLSILRRPGPEAARGGAGGP